MKHIITLAAVLILWINANAQRNESVKNLPNYDMKRWHFGFSIGANNLGFRIVKANDFASNNLIYGVDASKYTGFHIGPLSNLRLNKYMDLRMLFDLSFNQRDLIFHYNDNGTMKERTMLIKSTMLEFPILIKYKAERMTNFAPYVVAGGCFRYDLSAGKEPADEDDVRLKSIDPCITWGVGFDFYLEYFKLAIELRYSLGLLNTINPDPKSPYTSSIKNLKSNAFTISFHFE